MAIASIPTIYNGIEFRSRFEADVAQAFDNDGVTWEYEPRSFLLPSGVHFMPDFYLPELLWWIECRGYDTERGEMQLTDFPLVMGGRESFVVLFADGEMRQSVGSDYRTWMNKQDPAVAAAYDAAFVRAVAAITRCNQRRHPNHPGWRVADA